MTKREREPTWIIWLWIVLWVVIVALLSAVALTGCSTPNAPDTSTCVPNITEQDSLVLEILDELEGAVRREMFQARWDYNTKWEQPQYNPRRISVPPLAGLNRGPHVCVVWPAGVCMQCIANKSMRDSVSADLPPINMPGFDWGFGTRGPTQ